MELRFKSVALQKSWILLDDKIIYGGKEIQLSEVQTVKLYSKSSITKNGVIQITVNNKALILVYSHKMKVDGEKAFAYLQDYCCTDKKSSIEIQNEINSLPYININEWLTTKEIDELPNILSKEESIKAITSGLTDGNTWLVVCTNKRVLMLDKGLLYGLKFIDIPLDRVNSITYTTGLMFGNIAITDGAVTRAIENVSKGTVSFFADTVNKQKEIYTQSKNTPVTQVVNTISTADEILKFKELLDIGVITQEEFEMKKKKLLNL